MMAGFVSLAMATLDLPQALAWATSLVSRSKMRPLGLRYAGAPENC